MTTMVHSSKGERLGYRRVSSADQNTIRQLDGVELDRIYEDHCSGKDTNRPELAKLIERARSGDVVVVHSFDRLARNLSDLKELVSNFTGQGIAVQFLKEGLTFTGEDSPMANLMLNIMGSVAEFERAMILERQREGIAKAVEAGRYKGSKPKLSDDQVRQLLAEVLSHKPMTAIAKTFSVSRETAYQYVRDAGIDVKSRSVTDMAALQKKALFASSPLSFGAAGVISEIGVPSLSLLSSGAEGGVRENGAFSASLSGVGGAKDIPLDENDPLIQALIKNGYANGIK